MKNKVLIISVDALVREDIEYLSTKPNFSKIAKKAAQVKRVKSVYPSLTYPAHATLLTGCYPDRTGIFTNGAFAVANTDETLWVKDFESIKVEDLFAVAKRAGYTTASVYWPTQGGNPNIDYLVNEYFFPDPDEDILDGYRKNGASEATIAAIQENLGRFSKNTWTIDDVVTKDNSIEDFVSGCACSIIRRYNPDLLLMHNCMVDATRHHFGVFCNELYPALDLVDEWLGELVDALEDAGSYENTNFIILSDHGQKDYYRMGLMNVLLRDGGFITTNEDGEVIDWSAFTIGNGMSTNVFLKDPDDTELYNAVERFLRDAYERGDSGIQAVYRKEEVELRYHLSGPFSFIVEAEDGIVLRDNLNGPVLSAPFRRRANHGYLPEKGPWPVFIGSGPSFKPGVVIPYANLVDVAPTVAEILGISLPNPDGIVLRELIQ